MCVNLLMHFFDMLPTLQATIKGANGPPNTALSCGADIFK